ncbi:MAG: S41 family peptidase [Lachnospiraceae bacterium]|nr:S41 family peptidase [Lachnospiraceae bacterium]
MDYQNNEEFDMWQQEPPQRPKSRIGLGIVIGVFAAIFVVGLAIGVTCMATGTQIVFARRGVSQAIAQDEGINLVLDEDAINKINELAAYTKVYYYNDVNLEDMQDSMYEGMIEGLGDKYSVYYNEDDYTELQLSTTGKYYGIGAGLSQDLNTMVVSITKVYKGTPSEEAGLKNEDIILSVEDIDATSMEVSELVKHIRGEEGTTVHLEIYRPGTDEYLSFDVMRADITLPSVDYAMLENNIGYIVIDSFETDTAHQFEMAVDDLTAQGMQAVIFDVRYNPGGMVSSVVEILDRILPEGLLVYIEDKIGNRQDYTSGGETYMELPIAVLINEDSASASEIFAGAIKDYEYGTLIGTTTFGKGIVQTIFPLQDGDAIKLTTAKYFTPSGNYIHEVGIEPDIELEYEYLNPEGEVYERQYDNQILKAIEVLEEELAVE